MIKSQVSQSSITKDQAFHLTSAIALNVYNAGSVDAVFFGRKIVAGTTLELNFGGSVLNESKVNVLFDRDNANYGNQADQLIHIIVTIATTKCSCG